MKLSLMRCHPRVKAAALEAVRGGETIPTAARSNGVPVSTLKSWIRRSYGSTSVLRRKRSAITEDNVPGFR